MEKMRLQSLLKNYSTLQLWNKGFNWEQTAKLFSPSSLQVFNLGDACFFGKFPTLGTLTRVYGLRPVQSLLAIYLMELNNYSNSSSPMNKEQIKQAAEMFVTDYPYLKVTELMWFFKAVKKGEFGEFYGSISPIKLGCMMQDFLKVRNSKYNRHESERNTERLKADSSWSNQGEYLRCVRNWLNNQRVNKRTSKGRNPSKR